MFLTFLMIPEEVNSHNDDVNLNNSCFKIYLGNCQATNFLFCDNIFYIQFYKEDMGAYCRCLHINTYFQCFLISIH